MNELIMAIRSPKEIQAALDKSVELIEKYLCKFLNKKYNFNFSEINVFRGQLSKIHLNKDLSIHIDYNNRFYSAVLFNFKGNQSVTLYCESFKWSTEVIERVCTGENLPIVMYFNERKNIDELYNYIKSNYEFLFTSTYLHSLPKAYTFLLCNSITRMFPRDIAKLITKKLLFFKN